MNDRDAVARELNAIELQQRELEILYEQYFAGVEKREPVKGRETLALRLRQFANRRIMQTDLRFKYQNLATRFHSYAGYWDRILRLIDEGRYLRQTQRLPDIPPPTLPAATGDEADALYRELVEAHRACRLPGALPAREQLAAFLERQREKLREKFGDREVVFRVAVEEGKPKIKVRAKG
jgi:hypothetical protein